MIYITNVAQNYLKRLVYKENKLKHLTISITNPGTSLAECKIAYSNCIDLHNMDIEVRYIYFNIYINKMIIHYLQDAKIDLIIDELNEQLVLVAPHAKNKVNDYVKNCYSDDQNVILLNKLRNYIALHINPMLMQHGGKIVLMNLTKLGYLNIKFLGSCNGCAMSNTTLHHNIEKKILHKFPELTGVIDVTKHHRGNHSFY